MPIYSEDGSVLIHDTLVDFEDTTECGLLIKRTQEVPDEFFDRLHLLRANSINGPMGDMHCACVIPVEILDEWKREGFDAMDPSVSIEDVMRRLRKHEMDKFIATQRKLY